MPYIRYVNNPSGAVYASLVDGERKGKNVEQKYLCSLGRVLDKEKGIYKNRKRGVFQYSLESGYSTLPNEFNPILQSVVEKEKLILDFGDAFVLDAYFRTLPFYRAFHSILPTQKDTLLSLLYYRILTDKKAYCYADTWWTGNYASILFPQAKLQSQRVSEFLVMLGEEEVQRAFFHEYLAAIYGNSNGTSGILIDSTGLSNASRMSLTQISNHNGDINMEIRLIYVVDRRNGMPIYFRYCPGNIVDVSTLCTTLAELSQFRIAIDYAIVDAGYFSEDNVKELYKKEVHFITRLAPNRNIYKQVTESEIKDIFSSEYAIRYGNRLVYMKKKKVDVYGYTGYAYVGVDMDSRNQQLKRTVFSAIDDKKTPKEMDERLAKLGVFMLLSSKDLPVDEVLPLYYTRQQIEQVFDIGKNNADLLPLRVQNEETFRGHLMLTFMATAILQSLQRDILSRRKKTEKINPEGALMNLRNQKCKVYDNCIVPQERVKKINDIYKLLDISCPVTIDRGGAMLC
jgi:Transposase